MFSVSAINAVAQAQSTLLRQLNVLRMVFPGSHFLRLAFGLCFYPISLPPLYFPLIISVTGAWFHWRGGQWLESIGLPAMGV